MIKVAFFDRDGVINIDHGYVFSRDQFEFTNGIFTACRLLRDLGYELIVVTNQSGIARGYYSEQDFLALTAWMGEQFKKQGVALLDVFYCPHHPQAKISQYRQNCRCRKPSPGMFEQACQKYPIDIETSIMIGDRISDIQAAKTAGIGKFYLLSQENTFSQELKITNRLDNLYQLKYFLEKNSNV
ncbi:D-glycero-beta-D-manno-heptose 1,7-bisphosphate 7-phosphatase [Dolichospermum circinale]|uniref:D-glycero-beta-D-manno-heptose 1,7-bisphosphate 7-phosphatase n=1 Tax=Dolichospermum circinale TaxID=109265 RepID=UPI00041B7882|nr:D-glycero-beta-D-manno-heptose 1,7-bisphosphate 7-phosphatase [Dolichospermum circinale]MDB9475045.1 D-glycero-beta-D-manno-heptose 1,7-bisphosphate 7-phosphatase [Dolichospermum circinale CS-537/11]MDB9480057.1 D-glycero-beta-D-manno-heptose 1,7-bisphosphate 7-phosphatase [Dolichospermum circinale CS-537/03]